jgi:hypothetical protein
MRSSSCRARNPFGREVVNTVGRYTPVVSSLWYTRAAYRNILLDQLQYLTDPEAHKNFRERGQRLRNETRQGMWWKPCEVVPDRLPARP